LSSIKLSDDGISGGKMEVPTTHPHNVPKCFIEVITGETFENVGVIQNY
jgi:hypothetical protein